MSDADVVSIRPDHETKAVRNRGADDGAHHAPRIVQYVNAETADNLLVLCGSGRTRPTLTVVALDDQGQTWSLEHMPETSPVESERGRLIWRRLWVPPLPHGDGGGNG